MLFEKLGEFQFKNISETSIHTSIFYTLDFSRRLKILKEGDSFIWVIYSGYTKVFTHICGQRKSEHGT